MNQAIAADDGTRLRVLAAFWMCVVWLPLFYAPAFIKEVPFPLSDQFTRLAVMCVPPALFAATVGWASRGVPRRGRFLVGALLLIGLALINIGICLPADRSTSEGRTTWLLAGVLSRVAWLLGCGSVLALIKTRSVPPGRIGQANVGMRVILIASFTWFILQVWLYSMLRHSWSLEPSERLRVFLLGFFCLCADGLSLAGLLLFLSAVLWRRVGAAGMRGFEVSPL